MKHLRFFPYGTRGSTKCFEYLTSLKKPVNFVKWLNSYDKGVWDPTILLQKQNRVEKAILAKLSLKGRDSILSQKNAVILGYLKALGHGGLYSLKREGLQRKLNDYVVKKKVWEPVDGGIKLPVPTKRRSRKKKKPVLMQKKHVDFTLPNSTASNQTKKKPTKPVHDIGIKDSFATGVTQTVPEEKSQT